MKHRRRKNSLRLKGWDYRAAAWYFVTFCTHQRLCLLEQENVVIYLTDTWARIPDWKNMGMIQLDAFVIMPNHIHALLAIETNEVASLTTIPNKTNAGSISTAVGTYKSTTSRQLRKRFAHITADQTIWQRGYYDRIVHNERDLNAVRRYIELNPIRWREDRDNLDTLINKMTHHPD